MQVPVCKRTDLDEAILELETARQDQILRSQGGHAGGCACCLLNASGCKNVWHGWAKSDWTG